MLSRRTLIIGGVAAGAATLALKPGNRGSQYSPYFKQLNRTLQQAGVGTPSLVIDQDRLDHNIDTLVSGIDKRKDYRIVCKSLPSIELIEYIMQKAGTNRLMAFHQPFLNAIADKLPQADVLMGKPMPVNAVRQFYQQHEGSFRPELQLQWLVDTTERLEDHLKLAKELGNKMLVSLEIDIGLHRGGFNNDQDFIRALQVVQENPGQLKLAGLMGYDAHVGKIPTVIESADETLDQSLQRYNHFLGLVGKHSPGVDIPSLTLNGAGSRTILMHDDNSPVNDLSAGSCLVMPRDFDVPVLGDFQPAAFIATPVIKALDGTKLPGAEFLSRPSALWNPNWQRAYFIYGGNWMARYESPPGLEANPLYGSSSNQEIVNGSASTGLAPGDFIFLRPTQSEAVLLQFGDLLMLRNSDIIHRWEVLPP